MKIQRNFRTLNATQLRRHIAQMAFVGKSFHIGCAFSIVELVTTLYSKFIHYNPNDPTDPDRDYMILSKGHGIMAMYAAFREVGWIQQETLDKYFADGSLLHGLCEWKVPGCEISSGSLGHGLPIAVGIALGLKRQGKLKQKVYCLVGDGEMNEGTMWESLLFANHHQLDNLVVIVDANGFQAMGEVNSVMGLEPLAAKFQAFGFTTLECDGHKMDEIEKSLHFLVEDDRKPSPKALVARTVKGKGVSFMENNNMWHYKHPDTEVLNKVLEELNRAN
ncbi:MAG: transketolase [Pseudobdellovibrionaceae bacterium]